MMICIYLSFDDFNNRVTFKDKKNKAVVNTLVREVKALNSTFLTEHIKGMWEGGLLLSSWIAAYGH